MLLGVIALIWGKTDSCWAVSGKRICMNCNILELDLLCWPVRIICTPAHFSTQPHIKEGSCRRLIACVLACKIKAEACIHLSVTSPSCPAHPYRQWHAQRWCTCLHWEAIRQWHCVWIYSISALTKRTRHWEYIAPSALAGGVLTVQGRLRLEGNEKLTAPHKCLSGVYKSYSAHASQHSLAHSGGTRAIEDSEMRYWQPSVTSKNIITT